LCKFDHFKTKREVSRDARETNNGKVKSTRICKEQQGGQAKTHDDRHSERSLSSKDSKIPKKFVKSLSSTKEHKSETLHSSKKIIHTFIERHEDSDISNSKISSNVSFWSLPNISSGVGNLSQAKVLEDNPRSLIISMNI
jgi:hypothetical protein